MFVLLLTVSTLVTFAMLLALVRIIGSTQLTQLTYFNRVAGASMGNLAANMIASTTIKYWLVNCYTLIIFSLCTIIAAFFAIKFRGFRRITTGEPIVLIHKGIMYRQNLRKTKVKFSYSDIEFAILEPTGNLSILPTPESQSVSKLDITKGPDISDKGQGPFMEIVLDGEIDQEKLKQSGHNQQWVQEQMKKLGADSIEDVLYLAVNEQNEVIADLHRRKLQKNITI